MEEAIQKIKQLEKAKASAKNDVLKADIQKKIDALKTTKIINKHGKDSN